MQHAYSHRGNEFRLNCSSSCDPSALWVVGELLRRQFSICMQVMIDDQDGGAPAPLGALGLPLGLLEQFQARTVLTGYCSSPRHDKKSRDCRDVRYVAQATILSKEGFCRLGNGGGQRIWFQTGLRKLDGRDTWQFPKMHIQARCGALFSRLSRKSHPVATI